MMALVLAASARAPAPTLSRRALAPASAPTTSSSSRLAPAPTTSSSSQAPAPAPSQGSCPPGFKSYLDLTNTIKSAGKDVVMVFGPSLTSDVSSIVQSIPHTGITLCLCVKTNLLELPIQCVSY
ncbi:hypothetical protein ACP70R_012675 [Stipagrostis hirtigluma subsp. patula]